MFLGKCKHNIMDSSWKFIFGDLPVPGQEIEEKPFDFLRFGLIGWFSLIIGLIKMYFSIRIKPPQAVHDWSLFATSVYNS